VPYVTQVMQSLVFTPVADTNNATDTVQIRITTDDQANGGPGALTDTDTFAVNVTPVNDAPLLTQWPDDVVVVMNSSGHAIAGTASAVVGPASAVDELVSQTISYEVGVVATTGTLAFSAPPAINADGALSFTPAAGTWGTATVQVLARDSGGTANDGVDVSAVQTFTITVTNSAPVSGGLPGQSIDEDASSTSITLSDYFSDSEDDPAALTYSVTDKTNPALFGSVSVTGGVLTFTPAPNANGSATLTVRATDSGGLTVDVPLAVTVNPVNDAPSFAAGTDLTATSSADPQSVGGWATALSAGPANEAGQSLTFTVSVDNPLLFAVQPAIDPVTGALTFTPLAGASGQATITVVLHDNGGIDGGGIDASAPATFTITLTPPAATPGMEVIGTNLVITGGSGADSITLSPGPSGNGVKVTGTLNGGSVNKTFKQTLTGIRILTGAGNDSITIGDGITLPAFVNAGAGADYVKGGGGSDVIFGGDGDDTINAAAGDDTVDAGAGNDTVTGGLGRDLLWGGTGDDTIQGGDGNDFLIGGLGADSLYGQNGFDILVGGTVTVRESATDSLRQVLTDWDASLPGIHDTLRARLVVTDDPASADRLEGGADIDWFWSGDPLDTLDLQAGEARN
jgi:Ca2+-binding RTX toxin-like protein